MASSGKYWCCYYTRYVIFRGAKLIYDYLFVMIVAKVSVASFITYKGHSSIFALLTDRNKIEQAMNAQVRKAGNKGYEFSCWLQLKWAHLSKQWAIKKRAAASFYIFHLLYILLLNSFIGVSCCFIWRACAVSIHSLFFRFIRIISNSFLNFL